MRICIQLRVLHTLYAFTPIVRFTNVRLSAALAKKQRQTQLAMMGQSLLFLLCLVTRSRGLYYAHTLQLPKVRQIYFSSSTLLSAKPKSGSIVDTYQTVSVNCAKCNERLFRYKKKNGTKSTLVKCYVERITDDCAGILASAPCDDLTCAQQAYEWQCPSCQTHFARTAMIHGKPALKMVGGKIRMTKK